MNNRLLNLLVAAFIILASFGGARAQFDDQRTFAGNASGTNTIAITIANWTANLAGVPLRFIPAATNTGAATLNVTAIGAIAIRKQTANGLTALSGGEIVIGQLTTATYDGTFFVIAAAPNQTSSTQQVLLSGSGATYTTPAGVKQIKIRMIGGGGGGAAATTNNGGNGVASSFNSITANGGSGGIRGDAASPNGGPGGTGGSGTANVRLAGSDGGPGMTAFAGGQAQAGSGGAGYFGGSGAGGESANAGQPGKANTGGGGGGGAGGGSGAAGGGGGSGEYVEYIITNPAAGATYTYTVGTGGTAGAAGTIAGAAGGTGIIIADEFYN